MLKVKASCEISDLINEVAKVTGKKYDEVETVFFKINQYPTSTKTYLTKQFGPIIDNKGYEWLNDALTKIFDEAKIESVYVTEAI